jgi:PAS domain S-box-containing protein
MSRVVAIELDPATLDLVASIAAHAEVDVDVAEEASDAFAPPDDIEAVVIGSVAEPIRVVRRCQVSLERVPVVVVASRRECSQLQDAMRFSPYGARDVQCIPRDERERVRERIRATLTQRRRRAAMEHTFGALNRRIELTTGPTRRAADLLGRLLDIAPIGVAITDQHACVRELNARAQTLLGPNAVSLVGREIAEVFGPGEQEQLRGLLRQLNGDPDRQPRLVLSRGEDGQRCALEITGAKLSSEAGGPGYLLVLHDVTERQRLLGELQAANRAKDEFIAMLGHELRNPLAPVRTAVDLLRMRGDTSIERECATIDRQVGYMVQLVDDLLDVSRITQGKLELRKQSIEIAEGVARAVEMVSPLLEQQQHEVNIDVPVVGLVVHADPSRLAQVVANLLANAAKYTARQGKIDVRAAREGDEVVLRVCDNGQGISPQMLPRIFDLFVQERQALDRSRGGLGLGLTIVRNLVRLHGGTVSATSALGQGAEFMVRLPIASAKDAASDAASQLAPSVPTATEAPRVRVLVVDDNVDGAELMAELLQGIGYATDTAYDGPSALVVAAQTDPSIVLLDIGLPVMDGYEVARRLRETRPELTIIAITGYGQAHDREQSRDAGFTDHLTKPVTLPALQAAFQRAIKRDA